MRNNIGSYSGFYMLHEVGSRGVWLSAAFPGKASKSNFLSTFPNHCGASSRGNAPLLLPPLPLLLPLAASALGASQAADTFTRLAIRASTPVGTAHVLCG